MSRLQDAAREAAAPHICEGRIAILARGQDGFECVSSADTETQADRACADLFAGARTGIKVTYPLYIVGPNGLYVEVRS